jgi:hypothetical protein
LIDIDLRAVLSLLRIGWRMSDRNRAPEAGHHYKLTSVSLVLLKGRSVRPKPIDTTITSANTIKTKFLGSHSAHAESRLQLALF